MKFGRVNCSRTHNLLKPLVGGDYCACTEMVGLSACNSIKSIQFSAKGNRKRKRQYNFLMG